MNSVKVLISSSFILTTTLMACRPFFNANKTAKTPPTLHTYRPAPPSPLASHMLFMADYLDSIRTELSTLKAPLPDQHFSKIQTAKATHPHMKDSTYYLFAQAFLRQYNHFRHHPDTASYNALIALCHACHQHHCPGPLMRIEKMYLTDK